MRRDQFNKLVAAGIHVSPRAIVATPEMQETPGLAMDAAIRAGILARDSVPGLVTTPSAGIPAFLGNYMDPEEIRVIQQPMKAAEIYGETQKGNWTTFTTQFRVIESTGEVSTYGDYNNNGRAGHNVNFVSRESYHFQTFAEWGERETDIEALAGIAYVSEQSVAASLVLNKFLNKSAFFGVAGLRAYGSLNDPNLAAPIVPTTKTGGGTAWVVGVTDPREILADIQSLYQQLLIQMGYNLEPGADMVLAMSSAKTAALSNTNSFGLVAMDLIKRAFPALEILSAPELETAGGSLLQLRVRKVDGKDTTYMGFTEKMRNHAVIQAHSSWSQKKSAGTWGFIMRYPIALAQMLGI